MALSDSSPSSPATWPRGFSLRPLWIVLSREVAERRMLLLVAVLLGAVPFLHSLLPGTRAAEAAETRLQIGTLLALVAMGLTALILGSTIIARDLAERRLGFYFTRPIPGWAVWSGKVLAAFVLTLAIGALIALPAALAGWSSVSSAWSWPAVAGGLALLLATLALAHAGSVILRVRSPWLLLDLAAALALPLAVLAATRRLLLYGHAGSAAFAYVLGGSLLLVALAAGAVQVMRGRTDLRRSHRALSLALWGGLFAFTLAYLAFCRWSLAVEPADLRQASAAAAPSGPWMALGGIGRYRGGSFLVNADSGRFLLLPGSAFPLQFSDDGRRAAWFATEKPWSSSTAVAFATVDLSAAQPKPMTPPISLPAMPRAFDLSPDGSRLATIEGDRLLVYGLPRGDVLASAAMPEDVGRLLLRFLAGGERVRLYAVRLRLESTLVLDLDLATQRLEPRGEWQGTSELYREAVSRDGRHLFLWEGKSRTHQLVDLETGSVRALDTAASASGAANASWKTSGSFLPDGRLALVIKDEDRRVLRILRPGSPEDRRLVFSARFLHLGGQPAPDRLLVTTTATQDAEARDRQLHLVDLAAGTARPLGRGLEPVWAAWLAGPTSAASTLFFQSGRGLVRLDLTTGRETLVVPAEEATS